MFQWILSMLRWTDVAISCTSLYTWRIRLSNLGSICYTVQQVCIPQAILGTDVLCQAKSGLGKTAVFVLTTLQQIEPVDGETSVLIMCHTRELGIPNQERIRPLQQVFTWMLRLRSSTAELLFRKDAEKSEE